MKTIKLSLLALLFITFYSCSKDDDNVKVDSSMLVGDWNLSSFVYEGTTESSFEGTDLSTSYSAVAENIDLILTFNEDNTFKSQGKYDIKLDVDGITQIETMDNTTSTGEWSIDGDKLKTSSLFAEIDGSPIEGEAVSEMTIIEISESRLVLSYNQESEINQSGLNYKINVSGEYILTK